MRLTRSTYSISVQAQVVLATHALVVALAGGAVALLQPGIGAPQLVASQSVVAPEPLTLEPRADRSRGGIEEPPAEVPASAEPEAPAAPAPAPVAVPIPAAVPVPAAPVAPAPEPPPAPAPPPAPVCEADPVARGERVLGTLPDAWRSTGMPIAFSGPRQGYYGEVRTDQGVIHVYVRSCAAQTDDFLRHVIAHELGHAHEVTFLSDADREEYKAARGIPAGTPWYGCSGCADLATPAGDYAEVYGQWLRGGSSNKSQIGPDASPQALANLGARFFSIGS